MKEPFFVMKYSKPAFKPAEGFPDLCKTAAKSALFATVTAFFRNILDK